jgi:hypothetical protein
VILGSVVEFPLGSALVAERVRELPPESLVLLGQLAVALVRLCQAS